MLDNTCPLCGQTVMSSLLKLHIQLEKQFIKQQKTKQSNPKELQAAYQKYYLGFRQEAQELQLHWSNPDRLTIAENPDIVEGETEEAY
jgi:hypothetical protein